MTLPSVKTIVRTLYFGAVIFAAFFHTGAASAHERDLVEHLFERQNYNPLIRPVQNLTEKITVRFEMALIQLIMLDEKNQIMKSNIWLRLIWNDYQLTWNKERFGGIDVLRILPDRVWKPDIVLFNNADGKFEVTFKANVLIYDGGLIMWVPCTIYKSACTMDVEYFPFDEQTCEMIYGSWTYSGDEVDLTPYTTGFVKVDLTDYEKSGSWDVFDGPGNFSTEFDEKEGKNVSTAVYRIRLRRKTLYYTINLIIPCVLISSLSMIVFYLPATAGEKITMSVSILLALIVFLQVLVTSLLPPSSNNLPLFAKYLLFTIIMDVCCITNTIIGLNWNFKTPRTHRMPTWVRVVFLKYLPRLLMMQRPTTSQTTSTTTTTTPDIDRRLKPHEVDLTDVHSLNCPYAKMTVRQRNSSLRAPAPTVSPEMNKAIEAVRFVSAHFKNEDDFGEVIDDWRYVSLVMDRLLFYIYLTVTVVTTCTILIKTPILDTFSQAAYKQQIAHERECRDGDTPYTAKCHDWYPFICMDNGQMTDAVNDEDHPCSLWYSATH